MSLSALSFTISALYQQSSSIARQLEATTGITKPVGAEWTKERMVMNNSKQEEGQLYDTHYSRVVDWKNST